MGGKGVKSRVQSFHDILLMALVNPVKVFKVIVYNILTHQDSTMHY